ncbi:ABC-2 type transport system permease [Enterococcus sp. AZ194]|uniref:ABC transporter permease n=1 Tax=Enterococcus sp. AZ194 TaxID=2774629 RepID=UPI003F20BAEE
MNKSVVVVRKTFKKRVTSKSFLITMFLPLIFLGFIIIFVVYSNQNMNFAMIENAINNSQEVREKIIPIFSTLIIFLFIGSCANIIAQEIGSDKGSRLMEIILTSVPPERYFIGKLVGVFLIGLLQLIGYILIFLIGIRIFDSIDQNGGSMTQIFMSLAEVVNIWNVLFLILGIISYTTIAAMFGSLVTKKEDVSNAANPILTVALIGLYIGLWLANTSPNSLVVKVASQLPFFSPFVMPARLASTNVDNGAIILSVVLLLFYSVISILISMRIYNKNALNFSEKLIFRKN